MEGRRCDSPRVCGRSRDYGRESADDGWDRGDPTDIAAVPQCRGHRIIGPQQPTNRVGDEGGWSGRLSDQRRRP